MLEFYHSAGFAAGFLFLSLFILRAAVDRVENHGERPWFALGVVFFSVVWIIELVNRLVD